VTLNASALASYAEGADYWDGELETNELWNTELNFSADVAVTEQFTVTPSFLYTAPIGDDARYRTDTEMVAGLTVSHSF
jgi:hypothetical protein